MEHNDMIELGFTFRDTLGHEVPASENVTPAESSRGEYVFVDGLFEYIVDGVKIGDMLQADVVLGLVRHAYQDDMEQFLGQLFGNTVEIKFSESGWDPTPVLVPLKVKVPKPVTRRISLPPIPRP